MSPQQYSVPALPVPRTPQVWAVPAVSAIQLVAVPTWLGVS
nr:hypothetical protein [Pilimelia anulata]